MKIKQTLRSNVNHFLTLHPIIGRIIFYLHRQLPEGHMHKRFFKNIKRLGFQPENILDIGANKAEWTINFEHIFSNTNCYLIEPQIEMKPYLEYFCKKHTGSKYFLCGAGSKKDELTLSVWNDFAGSSILGGTEHSKKDISGKRTVPIVTVNELIETKQIPIPDLIKIDVQGYELEVLKGATTCFGITEFLILEVSLFEFYPNQPLFHHIIDYLEKQNYVIYDILDQSHRPFDNALGQMDVCFIRKESLFKKSNQWG